MTVVVATSIEPVLLGSISNRLEGVETDPTGFPVGATFTPADDDTDPVDADFKTATWETHTDAAGRDKWWVKVSIGSGTDVGQLDRGHYQCWVQVTVSANEKPVLRTGTLTVI
jgi:hypothetical protein